MSKARGWRVALTGAAVAVALTTCTDGGRKPAPTGPPQFVVGAPDEYDVRAAGSYNVNGATWNTSSDFGVGTGLLEPFMRVSDNDGNEEGFNTNASPPPLNLGNTAQFNHSLALNRVPVLTFGSLSFRELILDANESNSDPDANFSVDRFNLWLCEEDVGFDPQQVDARTDFEGNTHCALVYDLDDGTTNSDGDRVLATDASSKGSGNSYDYQILIPEANFTTAAGAVGVDLEDCSYAGPDATPCGAWLILDVRMGFTGGDFIVGATFEEVATLPRPWVEVTKDATPSFTRRYNWVMAKQVVPTSIVLFEGQNQNATWTITVSPGAPPFTDSQGQVSGEITIHNSSGAPVTINSVADVIPGYSGITPSCGVTFPFVLANNQDLVCTYSATAPAVDPGTTHTNTATVAILAALEGEANPPDAATFTGSADFDFANVTPTEIDKDPPVLDNYNGEGEVGVGNASDSPFEAVRNYVCDGAEGTFSNTARVDLTPPATDPEATATLTVDCLDVTVTKTANTTLQREYLWLIDKSVTPEAWELFKGDDGTSAYTVTVTPNGVEDDTRAVSGQVTIAGDANASVYLQSVSDAISPGGFTPSLVSCVDGVANVDLSTDLPYTLAAGHSLVCSYSQALPDATTRTNTATTVAKPTPTGTNKSFSGEAAVDFSTATLDEVNKTVHVDDSYVGTGSPQDAEVTDLDNETVFNYNRTFTCDADAGTHDNTATITETGQSDDASVTVACRTVNVTKDAITSFDRDWNWSIEKSANTAGPLTLSLGQAFLVDYSIVVTKTGPTDSDWHVAGEITVTHNHATRGALLNDLDDVVSPAINASVHDCEVDASPVTFPANELTLGIGETLTCAYDADLPDADPSTNTATATQQNHSYDKDGVPTETGTTTWSNAVPEPVTFGSTPTNETDECADVVDAKLGLNTNVCASTTFPFTEVDVGSPAACGPYSYDNTATVTPIDNQVPQSDNWSIPVNVPCPQGCTLTPGYWKTHNVSFTGGAPPDDNWNNITPLAELSGFFTTANSYPTTGPNSLPPFSWFNVFWTPVRGNAYYNLAHQYMAAKLNILNEADPTEAALAITEAEGLFANLTNTPEYVSGLKGNSALRQDFIRVAGTLGSYNEGSIGPGQCSEDATSSPTLTR